MLGATTTSTTGRPDEGVVGSTTFKRCPECGRKADPDAVFCESETCDHKFADGAPGTTG